MSAEKSLHSSLNSASRMTVYPALSNYTQDVVNPGAIIDMALCESQKLVLRPGLVYRFSVMRGCKDCRRIEKEGRLP